MQPHNFQDYHNLIQQLIDSPLILTMFLRKELPKEFLKKLAEQSHQK